MSRRVTVIGGGLAGSMAALAAAQAGAEVVLVTRAPGATALSSGGIDLVAAPFEPTGGTGPRFFRRATLQEQLELLQLREPGHPLVRIGVTLAELTAQARFFQEQLSSWPLAWKGPDQLPFLLPTEIGTLREMDMPPLTSSGGDLVRVAEMRVGVVGLAELPGYDPSFLAVALGEQLLARDRFIPLLPELLLASGRPQHPLVLARLLEGEAGTRWVAALAALVQGMGLTHLLLPPICGLTGTLELFDRLHRATGLIPFEALAVTSPCPGLRLQQALEELTRAAGVERRSGRVDAYQVAPAESRILAVRVAGAGSVVELEQDELILATGGLYSGGIVWAEQGLEAIFGLPLVPGGPRHHHPEPCLRPLAMALADDPAAPQAGFSAGLAVDPGLHPLGLDGQVVYANLRACGGVLAGHDPGARRGGSGVALLTGWRAGWLAAQAKERLP